MNNKSNIFNKLTLVKKNYLFMRIKKCLGKLKNTANIKLARRNIAKYISKLY